MDHKRFGLRLILPLICTLALAACANVGQVRANRDHAIAAAANPHAVDAALAMLRDGGDAVDAAIAAELVLGLVEPQSSGIGGGGFLMRYDAEDRSAISYDGRERAPASAAPDMFLGEDGAPIPFLDAQMSGLSIGAPSLMAMLQRAHDEHGQLPWTRLFEPAISLAENGFAISPRLHRFLSLAPPRQRLRDDPEARALYFDDAGAPHPVGYMLRNPAYAATLRALAAEGPQALQHGPIADAIVAAVQRPPRAGTLTHADLAAVVARRVEPVCAPYRLYRVCSMAPPSSGAATIQILALYERARPTPNGAQSVDDWAGLLWASRLAYADRDHYFADDAFVPVPAREMLAPDYLDQRAALIDLTQAPVRVTAGAPAGAALFERWGRDSGDDSGTTHLSIVDFDGDAVALTATVESLFGSQRMAGGFLLNNQLTDFSLAPTLNGRPVANAVQPGKAPRSSMSPTIITDQNGALVMVVGSPGGSSIPAYVARTIVGVLDWGQSPQEAIATGNVVARTAPARFESARLPAELAQQLRARGWSLQENASEESGLHAILATPEGLLGGADPRREGVVGTLTAGE